MGIEARIILYAPDGQTATSAAKSAFDRMVRLDEVMSDYWPESELMRVCRTGESGNAVSISDDLFRVLTRAQSLSAATNGAFDVTVGPVVQLWREARQSGELPEADAVAEAQASVGWEHLDLHPRNQTVAFGQPGMRLDLGGIGKGFAADEAMAVLVDQGISSCLVELGGDMLLGQPPPDAPAWRIAVQLENEAAHPSLIELANVGVATSGDTEQFVEIAGRRYSHIVDPRTGLGLTNRIAVTVIAPDATTADALASAISVLGPEDGLALLRHFKGASALVEIRTDHGVDRFASDNFPLPAEVDIQ